jgi:transcription elongation factor GreB
VAWAASNGDRSENADYQYGERRLKIPANAGTLGY